MSQKKRRKRGRTDRETAVRPASSSLSREPRPRSGTFFWGLSLGFISTLAIILASDMGWIPLAGWTHPPALAESPPSVLGPTTRTLVLQGVVPAGAILLADGEPVTHEQQGALTLVPVQPNTRALEIRGSTGPWWTTTLSPEGPDTLRPAWSGEIVVENASAVPGGSLFVDGVQAGDVSAPAGNLAPGWHVVSVQAGDVVVYEDACSVGPGEVVAITVPSAPPRGQARLIVRSHRLDANGPVETSARPVRLDGKLAGKTPLEVTVDAGFHSIAVGEPGHAPQVEVFRVDAGAARYVDIEARAETAASLEVGRATAVVPGGSLVVPVRGLAADAPLRQVVLHLARSHQTESVDVPLVVSPSDPEVWLGTVPKSLQRGERSLRVFASGTDALGRGVWSELTLLSR
jgi:hypothetical protein